jgi:hypothetical protein
MDDKKWIVAHYIGSWEWIKEYTDNYIIYDKTNTLKETDKIKHQKNVGYNIYTIMNFIVENHNDLPDVCVFIKSNVFKHCKKETFDKLINNNIFTPIEDYSHVPESYAHKKDSDSGYMERNNSWYIRSHVQSYGIQTNKYLRSYNQFLDMMFENPRYPNWIRFSPGANYIVPKNNILYYTKDFYEKLMSLVDYCRIPVEAHVIERALFYVFTNKWREK